MGFSLVRSIAAVSLLLVSATSASAGGLSGSMGEPASASPRDRAIARLLEHPGRPLRIEGAFGSFAGRADSVNAAGLAGLRAGPGSATSPRRVEWPEISHVAYRGDASIPSAVALGVALGASGGLVGASLSDSDFGSGTSGETWAGIAIGGVSGVILGGILGHAIPMWHEVYRSPLEARSSLTTR